MSLADAALASALVTAPFGVMAAIDWLADWWWHE